jgi:PAS domain S-box-containing protein
VISALLSKEAPDPRKMRGRGSEVIMEDLGHGAPLPASGIHPLDVFRLVAETTDDVFWIRELGSDSIAYVNDAYSRVWGASRTAFYADPDHWQMRIAEEDRASVLQSYDDLIQSRRAFEVTYRLQDEEGRWRWAHHKARIVVVDGMVAEVVIGTIRDMTERKLAEEHQRLLLREMNHRVKNTLATVVSIANQTAPTASSIAEFMGSFRARVQAFSGAHDLMMQNAWTSASLQEVIERTLAPYIERSPKRVLLTGPTILIPHSPAVALNMVFHELATNAAKYGALSSREGLLSVSWSLDVGETGSILNLRWEEMGGPQVNEPSRSGFGSRLIKRTLATLGGQAMVHFAPTGFDCWISLPLPTPTA